MALSVFQTDALATLMKPGMRVASMGYPDLIAPMALIDKIMGEKSNSLTWRPDYEQICRRHGMERRNIPDSERFFALMDCKLDVYDIVQERGCEILCDLNEDWSKLKPAESMCFALQHCQFDIVLDVGTAEHCFNIAQAMFNMAGMVKIGGYIIHENPFSQGNHGFFNLNPTFFADFYAANGFELVECKLVNRHGDYCEVPHTKRFKAVGEEMNVFALAQRVAMKPFTYPVQSKYAGLIPVAGVAGEKSKEIAHV